MIRALLGLSPLNYSIYGKTRFNAAFIDVERGVKLLNHDGSHPTSLHFSVSFRGQTPCLIDGYIISPPLLMYVMAVVIKVCYYASALWLSGSTLVAHCPLSSTTKYTSISHSIKAGKQAVKICKTLNSTLCRHIHYRTALPRIRRLTQTPNHTQTYPHSRIHKAPICDQRPDTLRRL